MITLFYRRISVYLLAFAALSMPWLIRQADSLPTNNRIETWLPDDAEVRQAYNNFRNTFGGEEVVLVAVDPKRVDKSLVEALCQRLEQVPGVNACWSPDRFAAAMTELGVPEEEIPGRLEGLALSKDNSLEAVIVGLSEEGVKNRAALVANLQNQIAYCQLAGDEVAVAGASVVVTELDRLGARDQNAVFHGLMMLISLLLLYRNLKQWKLSIAVVGLTVWAVQVSMALVCLFGGEMNFVLGAMSAMVLVFTLSTSVHLLHYCSSSMDDPDPLRKAISSAWKPCFWSSCTTVIGLVSLGVSDIGPVRQFGYAGAAGCTVSLFVGLLMTPAAVTLFPFQRKLTEARRDLWNQWTDWLIPRRVAFVSVSSIVIAVTSVGLFRINSRVDPLDFLPKDSRVLTDVRRVERDLTSVTSIEAIVDFGPRERPFIETLADLRRIERKIAQHPTVRHTLSAATFFPSEFPDDSGEALDILIRARSRQNGNSFASRDGSKFRISARVDNSMESARDVVVQELSELTKDEPIVFTGIAPLLISAQKAIFDGFWESFAMAFGIITVAMIVALRSVPMGLLSMIPNVAPITVVFGVLGWLKMPVDIGTMMTASIALGIAVDGTFHFMVRWQYCRKNGMDVVEASRDTLLHNGSPIFDSAVIACLGMTAMLLSPFAPMARFGGMMMALMVVALIGDLGLLPTLLCFRSRKSAAQTAETAAVASSEPTIPERNPTPILRPLHRRRPMRSSTRV